MHTASDKKVAIGMQFPYRTLVVGRTIEGVGGDSANPTNNRVAKCASLAHPHVAQIACATPAANINLLRDRMAQAWMAQEVPEVRRICKGFQRRLEAGGGGAGWLYRLINRLDSAKKNEQKMCQKCSRAHYLTCLKICDVTYVHTEFKVQSKLDFIYFSVSGGKYVKSSFDCNSVYRYSKCGTAREGVHKGEI